MHMSDTLISTAVGAGFGVISVVTGFRAARKIETFESHKIPLMGVMGAFVFAGQMINFTIPGTGSSGHIGGGILLAALLGPEAGFLTLAAVLTIQALFFGDGGLLALGCNVFNMGFWSCYIGYPLLFKSVTKKGVTSQRLFIGSVLAVVVALQFGAFSVVLETLLSGKTELPFLAFTALMQPIHLAIGLVEGLITASILVFLWKARPELLEETSKEKRSLKGIVVALLVAALVIGGGGSLLASSNPDGLEWAMGNVLGQKELSTSDPVHNTAAAIQASTTVLPDYGFKKADESNRVLGTSVAGVAGIGLTFLALVLLPLFGRLKKKKRNGE